MYFIFLYSGPNFLDSLKKQINETNAELLRYKLMLAVAERNLAGWYGN
jgi:hypothetical protein